MNIESPTSLQETWCTVFRELGMPQAILACTYTFNAEFFSELRTQLEAAACASQQSHTDSFTFVPIDIVCDAAQYPGHPLGWNVTVWPQTNRLFHPKLLIVLFAGELVWSDGSLNLTRSGWHRNREIAMLHRPGSKTLPAALRTLLNALPSVRAARIISGACMNEEADHLPGRFVTSLQHPIGPQFLATAPRSAQEVHVVAPFFEKGESAEQALDARWLATLVSRYREAQFHVYLPTVERDPIRVQGDRTLFADAQAKLKQWGGPALRIYPVEANPGPLHAKIVCIVHQRGKTMRAAVLVGSPNMTHAALLAPNTDGNIETAWILDERWAAFQPVLKAIGGKAHSIDDVKFIEPVIVPRAHWQPLKRAVYDPFRRLLHLEWKDEKAAARTQLSYGKTVLRVTKQGEVCPFDLTPEMCWLTVIKKSDANQNARRFPIEIAIETQQLCQEDSPERSPEDWLNLLGAGTESMSEREQRRRSRPKVRASNTAATSGFTWSEQVRSLAARTRYLEEKFTDSTVKPIEQEWLRKLFDQIFDAHGIITATAVQDQVWRMWVRLELWQAATTIGRVGASKQVRREWADRACELNIMQSVAQLPMPLRHQFRSAIASLEGAK